jgi:hypothetical protein
MVNEELQLRIDDYKLAEQQIKNIWERTFQFKMHELNKFNMPIISKIRSKKVKYSDIRFEFQSFIDDYLLQMKCFNYFEDYELSGKLKYLAERTVIEYVKLLIVLENKIEWKNQLMKFIYSDFIAYYFTMTQYIIFDKLDSIKNLQIKDVDLVCGGIINEINNWYDQKFMKKANKEVIQCLS